jgi:hypothetical protein
VKPRNYQKPHVSISGRARCPICKEAVYSPAGIHPQCAMTHPSVPDEGWAIFDQFVQVPAAISGARPPADRDER